MEDIDRSDMKSMLEAIPDNFKVANKIEVEFDYKKPKRVLIAGMGGSAYSGTLLKGYLFKNPMPIDVVRDYTLPSWVDKDTLIFAVSYSGNTEETLSVYKQAAMADIPIISISSGGKLEELAKAKKKPHILIPKNIPPRLATPYLFIPQLSVLTKLGIIPDQTSEIVQAANKLKSHIIKEKAKKLSERLKDKIPLIYSSTKMKCVAEKWKTDINENAKTHAFYNVFPEFNHNEIIAFEHIVGDYHVMLIKDEEDHFRIKKRIEIFKRLVGKRNVNVTEVAITGKSWLTRLLTAVYMGLWVSYYLAIDYDIDPTPVDIIEDLKKNLDNTLVKS